MGGGVQGCDGGDISNLSPGSSVFTLSHHQVANTVCMIAIRICIPVATVQHYPTIRH